MADEYGYDEDEEYGTQQGGGGLVNDLRKQLREKAKAEKDLRDQLAELQKSTRAITVREALKTVGVSEKVAALVPSDLEPTVEAVTAWIKEYEDVFGVAKTTETTESQEQRAAEAAQLDAMQALSAGAQGSTGKSPVTQDSLKSASSYEELMELIRKGANPGS
jgi:hypothetical protein